MPKTFECCDLDRRRANFKFCDVCTHMHIAHSTYMYVVQACVATGHVPCSAMCYNVRVCISDAFHVSSGYYYLPRGVHEISFRAKMSPRHVDVARLLHIPIGQ